MKMNASTLSLSAALAAACALLLLAVPAGADTVERAMFGGTPDRNMVSDETGLPESFDVDAGDNVLWVQPVGSQSYAGPVVAGGQVFVGTNNEGRRNPELGGDRGVVMAFDADTGDFNWQITHTKLPAGRVHDWPLQGVCSTPYIEGDYLYYLSNQAHVVKADVNGQANGNDGPFVDENEKGKEAGDIIWSFDLINELDVFPHNLASSSPLVVGNLIYGITGNGVDEGHINIPSPFGPSFVAVDKNTGKLVWESAIPGEKILHGSWANPSYAVIAGVPQVIFPGGDGWVYSFTPEDGKLIWKFDANPKDSEWRLGGSGTRNNIISTPVIYKDRVYIGVGQDPEHGEGQGNFWVINAAKAEGDITDRPVVWHRSGEEFQRTISTAAIHDGIVYITDLSGFLYALDAESGEHYWTYDTFAAVWGSPFVADDKVYLGDEDGDVAVLKAGKEMKLLSEQNVGSAIYTTPVAKDGVLYILSRTQLIALKDGSSPKPQAEAAAR
ncbi:MAG: PQQ-binding-like beta-propeller repeat protein [Acidobacteriota bacterium]